MAKAAYRNLRDNGLYVVILPRNDSSIIRRCTESNRYQDGHVFSHHGVATFYVNFDDQSVLIRLLQRLGFRLLHDLSNYRQVCLIFVKRPTPR